MSVPFFDVLQARTFIYCAFVPKMVPKKSISVLGPRVVLYSAWCVPNASDAIAGSLVDWRPGPSLFAFVPNTGQKFDFLCVGL